MKRRSFLSLIPAGLAVTFLPKAAQGFERKIIEMPQRHSKSRLFRVTMAKEYNHHAATEYYTITRHTEHGEFVLDAFRLTEEQWANHPEWCRLLLEHKKREHGVNHWVASGHWTPQYYRPPPIDRMMIVS